MILNASRSTHRNGFTLLEILLATLLATLVLAAVYTLLSVTLQQTQASRDAVEVEDLTRGVFNKFTVDLSGTLSPMPPKSGGNTAASEGGTTPPASADPSGMPTSDGSATPATGATAPTDGSADPNAPSATDNATAFAANYAFQAGVIGDEKKLVIYAGRIPEAFGRNPNEPQVRSDQRQIIYWLGSSGGLYRRERPWVTADGVRGAIENDEEATDSTLLAEEVADILFEYFDGTSWVASWDGTAAGPDGSTPLGPPRAIRVTLTLRIPVIRGEPVVKQMSQIIAIRSAPGTYTPPSLTATPESTDPATDPSMGGMTTPGMTTTPGTTTPSTPSTGTKGGTTTPSGGTKGGTTTPSTPSTPSMPSGGTKGGTTTPSMPSGGKGATSPGGSTKGGK